MDEKMMEIKRKICETSICFIKDFPSFTGIAKMSIAFDEQKPLKMIKCVDQAHKCFFQNPWFRIFHWAAKLGKDRVKDCRRMGFGVLYGGSDGREKKRKKRKEKEEKKKKTHKS